MASTTERRPATHLLVVLVYWCQHKHTKPLTHLVHVGVLQPQIGPHVCTAAEEPPRADSGGRCRIPRCPPGGPRGCPPTCRCHQQRREMKSALTSPCPCPCPTVPVRRTTRGRSVQRWRPVRRTRAHGGGGRAGVIVVMSMHVDVATLVLCGLVASLYSAHVGPGRGRNIFTTKRKPYNGLVPVIGSVDVIVGVIRLRATQVYAYEC